MMLRQESGPEVLSSLKKGEEQGLFRELSRSRPQKKTGPLLTRRPVNRDKGRSRLLLADGRPVNVDIVQYQESGIGFRSRIEHERDRFNDRARHDGGRGLGGAEAEPCPAADWRWLRVRTWAPANRMNHIITRDDDEIGALGCAQTALTDIKAENAHCNPLNVPENETRACLAGCCCVVDQHQALVGWITAAAVWYSRTRHPIRGHRTAVEWIVGVKLSDDTRSFTTSLSSSSADTESVTGILKLPTPEADSLICPVEVPRPKPSG